MIRNRIREVRKSRGLTLEKLAELTDLSVSQLSRIERHGRGWSVTSFPKIAEALNVDVVDLIDASNAWQDVELMGSIGQAVWVRFKRNGKSTPTVRMPAALGNITAVAISGSALYPRYTEGDVVAVTEDPSDPAQCINRECLVTVDTGYSALKTIQLGADGDHYALISHNEAPVMDRKIVACRPVVFVSRA